MFTNFFAVHPNPNSNETNREILTKHISLYQFNSVTEHMMICLIIFLIPTALVGQTRLTHCDLNPWELEFQTSGDNLRKKSFGTPTRAMEMTTIADQIFVNSGTYINIYLRDLRFTSRIRERSKLCLSVVFVNAFNYPEIHSGWLLKETFFISEIFGLGTKFGRTLFERKGQQKSLR